MSDFDKMVAFGQYLTEGVVKYRSQLMSECANVTRSIDAIRLRSGHVEAYVEILNAFTDLYEGDIEKFKKSYFEGYKEEKEKDESQDT
jgi:hypothetical protein